MNSKIVVFTSILLASGLYSLSFLLPQEVLIESFESKTSLGKNVYNKIGLISTKEKDIWLMNQNHSELKGNWDELKIVVDKTKTPYQANFFQLKGNKEIEYRISCFKCHANGPRAIRPNYNSQKVSNNVFDKIQVFLWNLKIKHYGNIQTKQNIKVNNKYRKVPLKHPGFIANKVIKSKTCSLCHGKDSYMGREELRFQQKGTIKHLVETGAMPPWPLNLSMKEKHNLLN